MKSLFAILTIGLLLSPTYVDAQTRNRRTTSPQRRRGAQTSTGRDAAALTAARGRIAERIKVLTQFIYLYGGIANDIEVANAQAERGTASPDLVQLTNRRRAALQTGLRDVHAGLDQLEQDFRTTIGFERYYSRLAGVTAAASDAEQNISAGQLRQAGKTLVQIVNQLTDTLAEM